MTKAIGFTLKQAGYKAGKYTVGYQSCDDSTAQAGKWDPAKCSGERGPLQPHQGGHRGHRDVQLRCAEIEVPIMNRVGASA